VETFGAESVLTRGCNGLIQEHEANFTSEFSKKIILVYSFSRTVVTVEESDELVKSNVLFACRRGRTRT
jgi:hypothetical protein